MRLAEGGKNPEPIVCLNPVKGLWRVRLAITETENGAEWMEHDFNHRPTAPEIRGLYEELVDDEVQPRTLLGLSYEGVIVRLSPENQMNVRSAPTVPVRFKLGEDAEGRPVYHTFTTQKELTAFNKLVADHIATCLDEGWTKKDAFDVEPYLRE